MTIPQRSVRAPSSLRQERTLKNLISTRTTSRTIRIYQDIEDRVIGGITFHGRTYRNIGYDWIQYIAQLDDGRALSIGPRNMDCVPGTMPDIILNNMTFQ